MNWWVKCTKAGKEKKRNLHNCLAQANFHKIHFFVIFLPLSWYIIVCLCWDFFPLQRGGFTLSVRNVALFLWMPQVQSSISVKSGLEAQYCRSIHSMKIDLKVRFFYCCWLKMIRARGKVPIAIYRFTDMESSAVDIMQVRILPRLMFSSYLKFTQIGAMLYCITWN